MDIHRRTLFKMTFQAIAGYFAFREDKPKPKKPSLSLRLSPRVGYLPLNLYATAELKGGEDLEEYHCLGIHWNWNDGSKTVRYSDCEPFDEETKIERFWSANHRYVEPGEYTVTATLFKQDKIVAQTSMNVIVNDSVGLGKLGKLSEFSNTAN